MTMGEELRRILLAGVGAMALSAEKANELVDVFVEKGELTVEQGKVLNEELRRSVQDTLRRHGKQQGEPLKRKENIADRLDELSPEELAAVKRKIAEMEQKHEEEESPTGE